MNRQSFFKGIVNGKKDIIRELIDLLDQHDIGYCVIGGLAVNAYVEPVVSLDLDIVVVAGDIHKLIEGSRDIFKVESFQHSINLGSKDSDIRIQIQTDPRYQEFIKDASVMELIGYPMKVARVNDVLKGKVWAYSDRERRASKRQKDLADIIRIIESFPHLKSELPDPVVKEIDRVS